MNRLIQIIILNICFAFTFPVYGIEQYRLQNLLSKNTQFKEDFITYLVVDFNEDGLDDVFLIRNDVSVLYLNQGKTFKEMKNDAGNYIEPNYLVRVEELGRLAMNLKERSGFDVFNRLYYLNDNWTELIMETFKKGCAGNSKTCVSETYKEYTLKPIYISNKDFENNFKMGTAKELLNEDLYNKLNSKLELPAYKYDAHKNVNSAVSPYIFRAFDKETHEFVGYLDQFENKFVSLQILKPHKDESVNLVGPNFNVHEVFGREPVIRLQQIPDESSGNIVGAPIIKQKKEKKTVEKAKNKVIGEAETSDVKVVDKVLTSIKDENKIEDNNNQWLYWLFGVIGIFVLFFVVKKSTIKK